MNKMPTQEGAGIPQENRRKVRSTFYRVRDWDKNFENNRTRDMKVMQWLALPIRLDGAGYAAIMEQEDGPQILGAWCAMIQVAAKCNPRGSFVRSDGKPMDSKAIARITRMPETLIIRSLSMLSGEIEDDLDWIEKVEIDSLKQQNCDNPAGGCDNPAGGCGETALHNITEHNITESQSVTRAHAEDPPHIPQVRSFGQTPEQQADRQGPPTKERFLEYAQGNAGWIALGLTQAQWEEIWLYGVGIEWRMPSGQMISDWKHWGIAQGRKAKNNPRPPAKPAAQGFGSTPYGSGREEILRQMREHQAKREAANAATTGI